MALPILPCPSQKGDGDVGPCLCQSTEGFPGEAFAGSLLWSVLGMLLVPASAVPFLAGFAAWHSHLAVLVYPPPKGESAQSLYPNTLTPVCLPIP